MGNPARVSSAISKNYSTLEISGDISDASEEAILSAYREVTSKGAKKILLKFHSDTFVNSAGLRVIIALALDCQKNKQPSGLLAFPRTCVKCSILSD